jgi:hypothetical protein
MSNRKFYLTSQGALRGLKAKRIRDREKAALYCQVLASNERVYREDVIEGTRLAIGATNDALKLADAAHSWAVGTIGGYRGRFLRLTTKERLELYAEAESMIRTGWSP